MINLSSKIQSLADDISATKTRQKQIRRFALYLQDWGIARLTSSKRKEIEDLLLQNNLEFIPPGLGGAMQSGARPLIYKRVQKSLRREVSWK